MSSQDILEKAIQKAIDGGWGFGNYFKNNGKFEWDGDRLVCDADFSEHYKFAIFNQDFCKALWPGDENTYAAECYKSPVEGDAGFDEYYTTWEYHLREMVISPDPIKYIGDNI